jgi:hypothetical protein
VTSALHGDSAPILRLERHAILSEGSGTPRDFSSGLYAATACEEIQFPWTRFSDPATRYAQIAQAVAQIPETALYPFDAATTEGNDFIRMCRRWPEASPAPAYPPAGSLPDVPVLMLSGEMDLRTPNEAAHSAAADWPHAQVLTIPNTGHSVLTADFSSCSGRAASRFLAGKSVPARCGGSGSPFFAFPPAPLSLNELRAARGVPGVRGRAISAVELTVFDMTVEFLSSVLGGTSLDLHGGGLRGGRWSLNLNAHPPVLRMHKVEYMPGIRVSGQIRSIGTKRERSALHLSGPGTPDGVLRIGRKWITGRLGGKRVRTRSQSAASAAAAGSTVSREELLRVARRVALRPRLR